MRISVNLLIFLFSFGILLGPAYNTYLNYDYKKNPDCETYMSIANGEFKDQSLIRRYRIVVPFAAKVVSMPFETFYTKLWKHRDGEEWPLRMGFFLVNITIMSFVGLMIYHCCKSYAISDTGSLLALIAILVGGRFGNLFAAIPITDSLYLLLLCSVIYALKTSNALVLSLCIIAGPLVKESFIFVAPLIFFLSSMSKIKQLILFTLGGLLVFSIRYWIDEHTGVELGASIASDGKHIYKIGYTIKRLASVRGLGELCTVLGLFSLFIVIGLTKGKEAIRSWTSHLDKIIWWFIPIILIHTFLSGEAARMLYAGSAAWAIIIGLIWDHHPVMTQCKSFVRNHTQWQ